MKNLIVAVAAAFAGVALAEPSVYWTAVETAAANADESGNRTGCYSCYYSTAAKAQELFGGQTVDYLTDYLSDNYATGLAALQNSASSGAALEIVSPTKAAQLTSVSWSHGQYAFEAKYGNSLAGVGSEYLAMLFYDDGDSMEIRVMSNDSTGFDMASGNVLFSDDPRAGGGTFGAWTVATVPEPTGGLLLLLGSAMLALRRLRPAGTR